MIMNENDRAHHNGKNAGCKCGDPELLVLLRLCVFLVSFVGSKARAM